MSLFDLNKGELEKLVPSQNEKEKWAFFSADDAVLLLQPARKYSEAHTKALPTIYKHNESM